MTDQKDPGQNSPSDSPINGGEDIDLTVRVAGDRIWGYSVLKDQRRILRKEETVAERILWMSLKSKQSQGLKFRRQHGIGPFIVDFYCNQYKLVVELDGAIHDEIEVRRYDHERQKYLEDASYIVLRIPNHVVIMRHKEALKRIADVLPSIYGGVGGGVR